MISHPSPGLVQAPWHGHHPGRPATGDRFHRRFVGGAACRDACAVGEALPPATAGGSSVFCADGDGEAIDMGSWGAIRFIKIRHFLEIWVLAHFFFGCVCLLIYDVRPHYAKLPQSALHRQGRQKSSTEFDGSGLFTYGMGIQISIPYDGW